MKLKKYFFYILLLITSVFSYSNDDNIIRVGMEVGYAPFNWYQVNDDNGAVKIENGYAGGYDVQIAKLIAKSLGKKLVIVPSDWDSLLGPALNSNKIDMAIAGMSPTEKRKESLDFSDTYYESDIMVVVKKDGKFANAKTKNDFKNAKITAQLNTMHYNLIDQLKDVDKQVAMENFPTMQVALESGKIDGYIAEKPTALSVSLSNQNTTYVSLIDGGFDFDRNEFNVAIAVKKGNTDLIKNINLALSNIDDKTRQELMKNAILNQPINNVEIPQNELSFFKRVKNILIEYGPKYLLGTWITIYLAIFGTVVGSLIGIVVASVNSVELSRKKSKLHNILFYVLKKINYLYILIFRGTPMIVQAMIFYYGLGQIFGINISPIIAALIIISVNTGAYVSEIFRGGIDSIDKGQYEATKALGFTHRKAMIYIIMPQVIRNVLPSIGNEFIINIKDSAVLFAIGVTELYTVSKQISGTNFRYYEVFIITCFIYFILTTFFSRLFLFIEKKLQGDETFEMVGE